MAMSGVIKMVEYMINEFFNSGISPASAALESIVDESWEGTDSSGFRFTRMNIHMNVVGHTGGAMLFGVAFGMNEAEIEAFIEATPSGPLSDRKKEPTQYCKLLGIVPEGAGDMRISPPEGWVIQPNWSLPEAHTMRWWGYAPNALVSGGGIEVGYEAFGVWLRD